MERCKYIINANSKKGFGKEYYEWKTIFNAWKIDKSLFKVKALNLTTKFYGYSYTNSGNQIVISTFEAVVLSAVIKRVNTTCFKYMMLKRLKSIILRVCVKKKKLYVLAQKA